MVKNIKVARSIENFDGSLCVDICLHSEGFFTFQEFRRDFEDPSGWFPIGICSKKKFKTQAQALSAAFKSIKWLQDNRPD